MQANPTFDSVCIQAFAKVSASISHEIKNTMSIINENAGLLDDLVVMGGGEGVSSERVKAAADTIARQVVRTNTMMNHLNRFAHTADHDTGQENLKDILSLVVPLTVRQAAAKNLEISYHCPENIQIRTHLLPFHALLYLTLRLLIDHSDDGDKLSIQGDLQDEVISVCYTAPCISDAFTASFSDGDLTVLLEKLKANSSSDENRLCITCPSAPEEEG
jgi:signal transduction histidine kinase